MFSRFQKKVHSSSYFKRQTLDYISKAKDKFFLKYKNKNNINNTNYSTLGLVKTPLTNKNNNLDIDKYLLDKTAKKSKISIKKGAGPLIKFNFFSSSVKSNYRKFIDNNNNIFINYKNMNNNSLFLKNKGKIKYSVSQDSKVFQKLNSSEMKSKISFKKEKENINLNSDNTNLIRTFNRKLTYKTLNNIIKKYKYKLELKKEEENKDDKVCLLDKDFKVKNFILNPNQVIDYLNLNEKNNFFQPSTTRKSIKNFENKYNLFKKNRIINRNRSALKENRYDKIKEIYPTVLNIEGQRNRKILYEINDEDKKKKKNEKPNCVYYKHHFNLRKRMFKEKSKAEEGAKANPSDFAYKSQLLILSMKIYQKAIHQLQKKISFKYNLDLPLYNLFLNLD